MSATGAASSLQRKPGLAIAARLGHAVNGLLHLLIGVIAFRLATGGGGGEADQSGALGSIAGSPGGRVLLWIIVVGLLGLGLWQLVETVLARGEDAKRTWAARAKELGKAVAYLAIAFTALRFAMGGSSDSSEQTQSLSARVLAAPGGVALLVVLGLAVVAVGVYFGFKGATKRFQEDISVPSSSLGRGITALGVAGYIAKGVALVAVGVLFVVGAVTADPSRATGLDGALQALAALPAGVAVLAITGLIAYGLYCGARARYAKL
ncbi:hypothetical protein BFL35_12030 [Clavibacter michiganensis]|nr:hypothetical protein BFL35_12030 [Clavibacter michiganensis]